MPRFVVAVCCAPRVLSRPLSRKGAAGAVQRRVPAGGTPSGLGIPGGSGVGKRKRERSGCAPRVGAARRGAWRRPHEAGPAPPLAPDCGMAGAVVRGDGAAARDLGAVGGGG